MRAFRTRATEAEEKMTHEVKKQAVEKAAHEAKMQNLMQWSQPSNNSPSSTIWLIGASTLL